MADRNGKEPVSSPQASLSERMRNLILGQRVEERRKPRNEGDDAGLTEERRRRDDDASVGSDEAS